jgi:CO/xanthine dehydrogenase Mo-binding subunit
VHAEAPGNIAAHMVQEVGDTAAAIAAAPHRLTLSLKIERSASMPMEGRGVYARWDSDEQSIRLYSSTQTSTGVRAAVAAKLGMPLAKVECIAPDVGGGFGVKIVHPWPEEVLIPWAARRLDAEVKWVEDRREHFISSAHERAQLQDVEVGFDDAGRVLGLSVKFWHDNGAYTPYGIIVPIITSTQLLGPYKPGAYRCEFFSMYTNTVMVTPYRGAGRPQGVFAMERTMDAIADYLGLDRTDVRSANFIQVEDMPYDHGLLFQDGRPLMYDSGDFPASLAKLKALVGWDEFAAYTRRFGYAVGTFASRAAVMSGNAIALAARSVREKALRIAGEALEVDPGDLEIVDGIVRVKGDAESSIALATVAVMSNPLRYAFDESATAATQFAGTGNTDFSKLPVAEGEEPGLEGKEYYSPPRATFANGMHAAIVETDPETAEITILRYCVIHDCGRMINPMIVEGQVHGGVAQGVGGALYERMVYDDAGQLLNASFMDFLMPYASEVPHIETGHLETPSPLNPLGIKGAGEAGAIPVSAVIASAIEDAEGFPITSMPISPAELWDLRRQHAEGLIPDLRRGSRAVATSARTNKTTKSSHTTPTTPNA